MNINLLRGHKLLPSDHILKTIPALYATERIRLAEKVIHLHFFVGACDWYLAEIDHTDLRTGFGYVNLGDPQNAEWGYFDLNELASVAVRHPSGLPLVVERDLLWSPRAFASIEVLR